MLNTLKRSFPVFLIFLLSLFVCWPYIVNHAILFGGETGVLINPNGLESEFLWNDKTNLGQISGNQPNIILFKFLWPVFNIFSQLIHPSITFFFLSLFLPGFFFYLFLNKLIKPKNIYVTLPGSLLYTFNIFRLSISYTNIGSNLIFISLPIFFYLYFRFLETLNFKYLSLFAIVTLIFSSMGGNLSYFLIPICMIVIMWIPGLYKGTKYFLKIILSSLLLLLIIILINVYWVLPLLISLVNVYKNTSNHIFQATNAGDFYDHIRFMGFWAFRSGSGILPYFSYYKEYYSILLISLGYLLAVISNLYVILISKKNRSWLLSLSFLSISSVSFFLVSGTKGPFGNIYQYFLNRFPLLLIYREPYAKFMPLFILSTAGGLSLSLQYINKKIQTFKYINIVIYIVLIGSVLACSYPLFTTEAMPFQRWNQGQAGNVLKVPKYWDDLKKYIEDKKENRVLITPQNLYVNSHNFVNGASLVGNLADFYIDKTTFKDWNVDNTLGGNILQKFLTDSNYTYFQKAMSLFGIKYIIQENDLEWRYSSGKIWDPNKMNTFLTKNGYVPEANFGSFTSEEIKSIPNNEQNNEIRNEFSNKLIGKPQLTLYVASESALREIYIPNNIIVNDNDNNIRSIVENKNFKIGDAIYFENQNSSSTLQKYLLENDNKNIKFKFEKINPTKYHIILENLVKPTVIIFSSNYNKDWKIFNGNYYLEDQYHFVSNGFSNGWIIDPRFMCKHRFSCSNNNGSYNLDFYITYWPQDIFKYGILISFMTAFILVIIVFRNRTKSI